MIKEIHPKEKKIVKAMLEVKSVLEKHNLTFWLDFGTLLGAVRDKKILPWEPDVDFFLIKNEKQFNIVADAFEELSKKGFEVCYFWEKGMINIRKKGSIEICAHFLTVKKGKAYFIQSKALTPFGSFLTTLWWLLTASKYNIKRANLIINTLTIITRRHGKYLQNSKIPSWILKTILTIVVTITRILPFKDNLLRFIWNISKINCKQIKYELPAENYGKFRTIKFYGKKFKIPCNYRKHIAHIYGEDWRIPKPNWDNSRYGLSYKKRIAKEVNLPEFTVKRKAL